MEEDRKLTFGCDPETVVCVGHADNGMEAIRHRLSSTLHMGRETDCLVVNQPTPIISPELLARMITPYTIEYKIRKCVDRYEKFHFKNHMQLWTKGK